MVGRRKGVDDDYDAIIVAADGQDGDGDVAGGGSGKRHDGRPRSEMVTSFETC